MGSRGSTGTRLWHPVRRQTEPDSRGKKPPLMASIDQPSGIRARPSFRTPRRRELLDASAQLQDLLSEFWLREVRHIQTDHDRRRRTQPATRRGARDAEVRGDGHVPGAVDEMPKAVVVALLRAGLGRQGPGSSAVSSRRSNSSGTMESVRAGHDGNSRGRVQDVRGNRSPVSVNARYAFDESTRRRP
jgi:hypothetical protein